MQRLIEADTGFLKGGGLGCPIYGYFILSHFIAGHIMQCTDKMLAGKMLVDKKAFKIVRDDKMLAIL